MNEQEAAAKASIGLPTQDEITVYSQRATGNFAVEYDGGGEYVLWFYDYNGTIVNRPGEPVQRWIKTYTGAPTEEQARLDAIRWLGENSYWL